MKKNVIKIMSFICILFILLNQVDRVLRFKYCDGIYGLDKFYKLEDNCVDVLFLGSSHAFADISPAILYKNYGFTTYDLGGSLQPLWNTYYYMREALKTQSPNLIVLEAYMTTFESDYSDESRIIKNNFGLKWSKDKVDSLFISSPETRRFSYFPDWVYYHGRYQEISKQDFLGVPQEIETDDNWKGHTVMFGVNEQSMPMEYSSVMAPMTLKNELYYRKIIELAQEEEIPVLIMVSPYAAYSVEDSAIYLHAEQIASEYGVRFIDYNKKYDELGLDFSKDCADIGHLNYRGVDKLTNAVGKLIDELYEVPDRRDENANESWESNVKYYEQMIKNYELSQMEKLEGYIESLHGCNENYIIIITAIGEAGTKYLEEILVALTNSKSVSVGQNAVWVLDGNSIIDYSDGYEEYFFHKEIGSSDLAVIGQMITLADGNYYYEKKVFINHQELGKTDKGINIVVYDKLTDSLVDNVGFIEEYNFESVR